MGELKKSVTKDSIQGSDALIKWLRHALPERSGNAVKVLLSSGKVWVDGQVILKATHPLEPGQIVEIRSNSPRQNRAQGPEIRVLHSDKYLIVAEKPCGILTLPFGEERLSLAEELRRIVSKIEGRKGILPPLWGVHRLDKGASGLVVVARDEFTQQALKAQFEERTVDRTYRALVQGLARFEQLTRQTVLVRDRGDGLKGSARRPDQDGKVATTHLKRLAVGSTTSLVECKLETGRTHQIRIHLSEMDHPLVGETVYIRNYRGPKVNAPRLMLHAFELGFEHPHTGKKIHFTGTLPPQMIKLLKKERYRPIFRKEGP